MSHNSLQSLVAALLAGAAVLAAPATARAGEAAPGVPAPAFALDVSLGAGVNVPTVDVALQGQPGQRYLLSAGPPGGDLAAITGGQLDAAGAAALHLEYPGDPGPVPLEFRAAFLTRRGIVESGPDLLDPDAVTLDCLVFDFESTSQPDPDGPVPTHAGQVVSPGNTWTQSHGLTIRVMNFGGGPDFGVIFDSFAPTGGDTDLSSPAEGGQGEPGGDFVQLIDPVPYGKILIIQENGNGCGDGTCDVPDDEAGGGKVFLFWEFNTKMCWLDLLDIDEQGARVQTFTGAQDGGPQLVDDIVVPPGPDNCFKRVFFDPNACIRSVEIFFPGSGAVAEFGYLPCTFDG